MILLFQYYKTLCYHPQTDEDTLVLYMQKKAKHKMMAFKENICNKRSPSAPQICLTFLPSSTEKLIAGG